MTATDFATELRQISKDIRTEFSSFVRMIRQTDLRTCSHEELQELLKNIRASMIYSQVADERINRALKVHLLESGLREWEI